MLVLRLYKSLFCDECQYFAMKSNFGYPKQIILLKTDSNQTKKISLSGQLMKYDGYRDVRVMLSSIS